MSISYGANWRNMSWVEGHCDSFPAQKLGSCKKEAAKSLLQTCLNGTKETPFWKGADCSLELVQHRRNRHIQSTEDSWGYSWREWVQIVVKPRGIWQGAPCLPAYWVLMNHWFGMLHVPCDGWCHWCIEDAQSSGSEEGSDSCSGWTWEAGLHCWLHTEHFTHSSDVTKLDTRITNHPALPNGNNCVMGWQFIAPFDSSDALYSAGVASLLPAQQGHCNRRCDWKTLEFNGAWVLLLHNLNIYLFWLN